MNLYEWLPPDAEISKRLSRHLDVNVTAEYQHKPFPQRKRVYKNIHVWCKLENGYAVGWNESPRNGWIFVLATPESVRKY